MYHERRVRERIIATEIMKLERRRALTRSGAHPLSPPARSRSDHRPPRRNGAS